MSKYWDLEELFFDGDSYYSDVLAGMRSARSSIDFEAYIFNDDPIGLEFELALAHAAARDLKVRMVIDGFGSLSWIQERAHRLAEKGVEIRVYHPVRFGLVIRRFLQAIGLSFQSDSGENALRIDRRDHRKLVIVDRKTAWVGSLNIAASHSARISGPEAAWRDVAAKVQGQRGLHELCTGFEFVFRRSHSLQGKRDLTDALLKLMKLRFRNTSLVRQNFTLPLRLRSFRDVISRLRFARERIWIINAYLAPSAPVVRNLRRAAERGTDVRIIVPRKSDVFFMPWVAGAHYAPLLKSGVRIFEYLPHFHHAKCLMIDNWATVGTTNLNMRSLKHDLEVDVVIRNKSSLDKLAFQFENDLSQCEEIREAPGAIKAFLGRLILIFLRNWI